MGEKEDGAIIRHVSAARAFHTGLIADSQRIRAAVGTLTDHLNVVRHAKSGPAATLAAVEAAYLHLSTIERFADAWRETYRDLRRSVRLLRFQMKQTSRPQRIRTPSKAPAFGQDPRH